MAQLVVDRFGVPLEMVDIVHGDTGQVPFGMGTYASRSLAVGGTALVKAMDKIIAKGKKIAAHLLEAAAHWNFHDAKTGPRCAHLHFEIPTISHFTHAQLKKGSAADGPKRAISV